MVLPTTQVDIQKLKRVAQEAGEGIMEIYRRDDFSEITDFKSDNSPLTLADKESHRIIATNLEKFFPSIPILSEEGKEISYEERKDWKQFWCVDPLDGTKEFINRNGEFTVNIALIEEGVPVLGVIFVPVTGELYYGKKGEGAFKATNHYEVPLNTNTRKEGLVAVGSRSHAAPEEQQLMERLQVKDIISKGSSLKFCMLAEGKADIYYRHGPTMEWDTAAGQAIVEAAGGMVVGMDKKSFAYNKQSLRNGSFYCLSNAHVFLLL